MSYTPTTWTTGDTITATALNKIENGIANAGSALICNSTYDDGIGGFVLDQTVQTIYDALLAGTPVYIKFQYGAIDSDYTATLYLAPVVKIFNYANTDTIRIVASKPSSDYYSKDSKYYVHAPGTLIYSATALNDYPQFYTSTQVLETSISTGSDL